MKGKLVEADMSRLCDLVVKKLFQEERMRAHKQARPKVDPLSALSPVFPSLSVNRVRLERRVILINT